MQTNLAPSYVHFIDAGGRIEVLVQELIDRAQYHEGFLEFLQLLTKEYEGPFEWTSNEHGRVRKIKQSFVKTDANESANLSGPETGDNGDQTVQSVEVPRGGSTLEILRGNYGAIE